MLLGTIEVRWEGVRDSVEDNRRAGLALERGVVQGRARLAAMTLELEQASEMHTTLRGVLRHTRLLTLGAEQQARELGGDVTSLRRDFEVQLETLHHFGLMVKTQRREEAMQAELQRRRLARDKARSLRESMQKSTGRTASKLSAELQRKRGPSSPKPFRVSL